MNKINLKCGGHIFVEPFDDHEEEDICKIYDEYDNYISEINVGYEELFAKAHYDAVVQEMADCEDFINWISCVFSSCTWGTSLKDLIDSVADDKAVEYTYEELQEELKEMYDYLEKHGEREFCTYYLINKVGDYYVCVGNSFNEKTYLLSLINKYAIFAGFDWLDLKLDAKNRLCFHDVEEQRHISLNEVLKAIFDNGMLNECFRKTELEVLFALVPDEFKMEVNYYLEEM